jgi:hypothetical protein
MDNILSTSGRPTCLWCLCLFVCLLYVRIFLWLENALLQLIKTFAKFDITIHDLTRGLENRKSSSSYVTYCVRTNLTFHCGHHSSLHHRNNNTITNTHTHSLSIHPSIHACTHTQHNLWTNHFWYVHKMDGKPDEIWSSWIVVIDWWIHTLVPRWWVWHTSVE